MKKEKHLTRNEQYNVYVEEKIPKTKNLYFIIIILMSQFLNHNNILLFRP